MGESLFPSSNDNALSVSQGRTEGHKWVKDAIPIKRIGLVMNGPLYWETLQNGLASCKHDQNRSMSVGSRKAVRCGLGFDLDLPAPLNNAYHGKVIYQGVSVLWGRTISLEKIRKM